MDNFVDLLNDILKNRVEDVVYSEGEEKIPFSSMTYLLDSVGISFQMKGEEQIIQELEKIKKKHKKPKAGTGALISFLSGLVFYYIWLEMILGMNNMFVEILLTLIFSDIVFAIYGYVRYKSSAKQINFVLGEYQCHMDDRIVASTDSKVFKRLHIPLPDAKMESYQSICKLLKNKQIEFPSELTDVRSEINYLKQRVADGVFEIRQDEVCILCPQHEK